MKETLSPMMRHYVELKEKYADCLLFYRLGDFYEMFFEDAKTVSSELDLVLTGRDCGLSERAPMCGVPHHAVDFYISKLIQRGYKVAICEQLEDPKLAKGLVDRDVIRVVTPGTIIDETVLNSGKNNYLASVYLSDKVIGLSYADVTTGEFYTTEFKGKERSNDLMNEFCRITPAEVIVSAEVLTSSIYKALSSSYYVESYDERFYHEDYASECMKRHFNLLSLSGFGLDALHAGVCSAGALIHYLEETQKNSLAHITSVKILNRSEYMLLDASTRRNLELTQPLRTDGSKKNTLLFLLNKTKTVMGARTLHSWIDAPLLSKNQIDDRLDAVQVFFNDVILQDQVCDLLSQIYDLERLTSKIVYGSLNPKDCKALEHSIGVIPYIKALLSELPSKSLSSISNELDVMNEIYELLSATFVEDPPASVKDGGFIKAGCSEEIDSLRDIKANGSNWLKEYEQTERIETGIKNLKIGYNHVFGYYIEVSRSYYSMIPERYERKQTLANAERFFTQELKEMEEKILGADERLIALEIELFETVRQRLLEQIKNLQKNALLISELDCFQSLAAVAREYNYVRPVITEDTELSIIGGRHPIVERNQGKDFVANDVNLDEDENRMLIITGPNMAGKSTYMRQVALITVMAHMGSYVPAKEATISLVDRIFTRIGASDDLATGQSTFMVEMSEVANILNNATNRSLLILDEIGRGTSTFDGLSIAWAVLDHIADKNKCGAKTLFATHYHELTELEGKIEGVKNYRITVKEIGDDIIFLRRIVRGSGDKSFGIQVAKLAGLPESVLKQAKEVLKQLVRADIAEKAERKFEKEKGPKEACIQGSIFDTDDESTLVRLLTEYDPDLMTPREALDALYKLRSVALNRGTLQ